MIAHLLYSVVSDERVRHDDDVTSNCFRSPSCLVVSTLLSVFQSVCMYVSVCSSRDNVICVASKHDIEFDFGATRIFLAFPSEVPFILNVLFRIFF